MKNMKKCPLDKSGRQLHIGITQESRVTESGNANHFSSGICPNLVWKTWNRGITTITKQILAHKACRRFNETHWIGGKQSLNVQILQAIAPLKSRQKRLRNSRRIRKFAFTLQEKHKTWPGQTAQTQFQATNPW